MIKKGIILLLLALNTTLSFSQKDTIWYDSNWYKTTKESASFFRPNPKLVKGKYLIEDYYINGKIQMRGESSEQNREYWNGKVEYFYDDGTRKALSNYRDNLLHGEFKQYTREGKISVAKSYVDGYPDGEVKGYHEDGTLLVLGTFEKGRKQGKWTTYFKDGKVKTSYNLKGGKLDGEFVLYNDEKKLIQKGRFDLGEIKDFTNYTFYRGSEFKFEAKTVKGIEQWKIYRDGVLVLESFFKKGDPYGTWKMYSKEGKNLYRKVSYGDASMCESFEIIEIEEYEEPPLLHHEFSLRFKDLTIHEVRSKQIYSGSCLHGSFEEYNSEGTLLRKIEFQKGEIVNEFKEEKENDLKHPFTSYN